MARIATDALRMTGTGYSLRGKLHESAANAVWLIEAPDGRRAILRLARTAVASRALQREADVLGQLAHPCLPCVIASFSVQAKHCLITTAFDGLSLATVLERRGSPLPLGLVLAWMEELCSVIDYLHNGPVPLIHRDIHPGHLILQLRSPRHRVGSLGLIDFGAAIRRSAVRPVHADGAGAVEPGSVGARASDGAGLGESDGAGLRELDAAGAHAAYMGHPEYAAPEQFLLSPERPDPRTDIYGMAATMYRLLTGQGPVRPFEFAPATAVNPLLPSAVNAVLEKALQPDPADRYASVAEWQQALAALRAELHPLAAPAASLALALAPDLAAVELSPEERAALHAPLRAATVVPLRSPAAAPAHPAAEAPHVSAAAATGLSAAPATGVSPLPAAPPRTPSAVPPQPVAPPQPLSATPSAPLAAARLATARLAAARLAAAPVAAAPLSSAARTEPAPAAPAAQPPTQPMHTPSRVQSRRSRRQRRARRVAWLLVPAIAAAGMWAAWSYVGNL